MGGRLGHNNNGDQKRPVKVEGMIDLNGKRPPVVAVAAGFDHSVALARNGAVFVWGLGKGCQLGTGRMEELLAPVCLPDVKGKVILGR